MEYEISCWSYIPEVEDIIKPKMGQEFGSLEDGYDFYNAYAKEAGFNIRTDSSKRRKGTNELCWKQFVCNKEGHTNFKGDEKNRSISRVGCKARVSFVKRRTSTTWSVSTFIEEHNHELATLRKVHSVPSYRMVPMAKRNFSSHLAETNVPKCQQLIGMEIQAGGIKTVGFMDRDLRNVEGELGEEKEDFDAETLFEYFSLEKDKDPSFYFEFDKDKDDRLIRCFWADSISRSAYTYFGDVVAFDTMYQTNKYGMIFASLAGVNHHAQTVIFGCGFLSDVTTESFVWLFDQWLKAMEFNPPQLIITDQDPSMTNAIAQRLPKALHHYCIGHIMNKFSESLGPTNHHKYYPYFQASVYNSKTPEEFETSWNCALEKSSLGDNKWLETVFKMREKWVPTYINHIFSAGMSYSRRAESAHNFLKKIVFRKNTLMDFVIRFSRALVQQRRNELASDQADINDKPLLEARFPMERQMVNVYTKKIFLTLQDELLESNSYIVKCVGEGGDENKCEYTVECFFGDSSKLRQVVYDKLSDLAMCTCRFFEFEGIPCRHILAFLRVKQIFYLPKQYILPRWTKSVKAERKLCGDDFTGQNDGSGNSLIMRHANLAHECLDAADDASISEEGAAILRGALRLARQKIKDLDTSSPVCQVSGAKKNSSEKQKAEGSSKRQAQALPLF